MAAVSRAGGFWSLTSPGLDLTAAASPPKAPPPAPRGAYSLKPRLHSSVLHTVLACLRPQERSVLCSSRVAFISIFLQFVIPFAGF